MGFLDFARDVGRQVFKTDSDAAANIKEHLAIKTSGIKNLDVAFDDGVATLSGECLNEGERRNAILLTGNIKGVRQVVADQLTVRPAEPEAAPEPEEEIYEIKSGDTLGAIAKRFYGKASAYTKIYEANRDIIDDPNKIYPGQKIRIPEA